MLKSECFNISEINILSFFIKICRFYKLIIIFQIFISIALICISKNKIIYFVLDYWIIFFLGIIVATMIHEYIHVVFMKIYGVEQVTINFTLISISIIVDKKLKAKQLLITALSGPLSCLIVATILLGFNLFIFQNYTLKIIEVLYYFHFVNLLPFSSDGRMIIKAMIS